MLSSEFIAITNVNQNTIKATRYKLRLKTQGSWAQLKQILISIMVTSNFC